MFETGQLEAQLEALVHRNRALEQECDRKEEEASGLRRKVEELQAVIEGQPLQQVVSGKVYQPDLNFALEEQINALTQQVGQLQRLQDRLQTELAQAQARCSQLDRQLLGERLEADKLRSDLEGERKRAAAKEAAV